MVYTIRQLVTHLSVASAVCAVALGATDYQLVSAHVNEHTYKRRVEHIRQLLTIVPQVGCTYPLVGCALFFVARLFSQLRNIYSVMIIHGVNVMLFTGHILVIHALCCEIESATRSCDALCRAAYRQYAVSIIVICIMSFVTVAVIANFPTKRG